MGEQERVLHYDKMETACAHFPPGVTLFARAGVCCDTDSLRSGEERRGEERSGASCCSKLKTDQRKMPQRGNMRALPARRDSQNYYRKMAKKDNCGQREQAGEQSTHTPMYIYLCVCVCVCDAG